MKHIILFIASITPWQFMFGTYLLFSVTMGTAALLKRPRRIWLEDHPEDRDPNE